MLEQGCFRHAPRLQWRETLSIVEECREGPVVSRARSVETVIVGAGQAGLVVSRLLSDAGAEHVLLDRRATLGGGWQDRWDGFQLVGPNWTTSVPGLPYAGDDPDGYMARDDVIAHFRRYAAAIDAPVELQTEVTGLTALDDGAARFRLTTSRGPIDARRVVVAGGPFGQPRVPSMSSGLDGAIHQIHAHDYRRPDALPAGAVLLVGSGQTGVQLAEELLAAGRSVVLSAGRCGHAPRRYRGKDIFWWIRRLGTHGREIGVALPGPETLPSPAARFACNPQLSGHDGGHDVSLRSLAAAGVRLAGRLEAIDGSRIRFADNLGETLAFADRFFVDRFQKLCDAYAARAGLDLPRDEPRPHPFEPTATTELDLAAEGIGTVIWTSGFRPAFDWIDLPVLDGFGLPIQRDFRTDVPGLAFIGTPWLVDMASSNLTGLVRDAEALVPRLLEA
jgi:putative flavoprotein involved in K+ transport